MTKRKTVITYGTYDLLHQGHINLLKRAKALGNYLIVGVTNDNFDRERGKLNVTNNVLERVEAIKATGLADKIIIEDYYGQKVDDIQKYNVDVFAIGSDWTGKFDYLKEYCEVVYLPRTEGISSTMLRSTHQGIYHIGIVGCGRIANRFVPEAKYVSGVEITSVFHPIDEEAKQFGLNHGLDGYSDFDTFLSSVDAIYIASPHPTHYNYAKRALKAGKHVLCEIPMVLKKSEAEELFQLAGKKGLVLLEASKTAFFPAFTHLLTIVKSGAIGEIVDVRTSLSKMVEGNLREYDPQQAGGALTEHSALTLMSIFKILGLDYKDILFYSKMKNKVDIFTKIILNYPHAVSSVTLGIGVKTEGNLVISGTEGYIYVPAPWWLTDYFEIRFENQTNNKKYFFSYDGDGLRYEIQEFISMIANKRQTTYRLLPKEVIAMASVIEKYRNRENFTEI